MTFPSESSMPSISHPRTSATSICSLNGFVILYLVPTEAFGRQRIKSKHRAFEDLKIFR